MSADSRDNLSARLRWRAAAVALAAFMAVGLSSTVTVQAQDATPAPAGECVAPDLPPGTPTPMDEASPVAAPAETDQATPVADEAAATEEEDNGTPAEGDAAAEIVAAVENIAACVNSGDFEGVAALITDEFMQSEFGTGNPYDAAILLEEFGLSYANASVDNPRTYEDGSVSADLTYMASQYQISGETFHLIQDGETWKVDGIEVFTPEYEGDSAILGVMLAEAESDTGEKTYSFTIAGVAPDSGEMATVAQTEVLLLHGVNQGVEDHEMVVFKLPEGADPMGVVDGSIPETDVEFVGFIELAPGQEGDMVLMGLQPGVYTMVCFFPAPDGAPHAEHGMVSQFEVTAPAA